MGHPQVRWSWHLMTQDGGKTEQVQGNHEGRRGSTTKSDGMCYFLCSCLRKSVKRIPKAMRISAEATSVLVIKALMSFMAATDYFLCGFGVVKRSTAPTESHTATLIMIKKTANDIDYLSFRLAMMILPVQQTAAFNAPNTTTKSVILSIPGRIGVSTMTAKNT
jgi:hypothetical protein